MRTALRAGNTVIDAGGRLSAPNLRSAHRLQGDEFYKWWNPCGIVDGKFVNLAPDDAPILQPDMPGGRACLYRDTGWRDVEIVYQWTGIRHQQGAPLLCINKDDPMFGIGVWIETEILPPATIIVAWQIGRQPSDIYVPSNDESNTWIRGGPTYGEGRQYEIKMRVKNGRMKGYVDGVEYISIEVPEGLRDSTIHGMSLDVNGMDNLPSGRVANADCGIYPYVIREIPESEEL